MIDKTGQDPRHVRWHEREPVQPAARPCCSNAWPRSRRSDLVATGAAKGEIELTILLAAHPIVHVNASLNALATVLLLVGCT